ncbi:RHS repeat protein, partial [Romeria aff. gracilis LEGE 07310]|nr:RHS repeat protein [Romeria aff. gracilis LEGE 07310]
MTKAGDHYQLREQDGTIIVFRADGQLDYIENANGYRITAEYTGDLLTQLSASSGDSFTISYSDQGRISTITDQAGQTTAYTYDSTGQFLNSVENSTGTTSFTYGHPYDPTALTSVTYADGSKVTYDYDELGRLQQVIQGEGRDALAYTYTYDGSGGYTITDPSGASTTVVYNDDQSLTVTDPLDRAFQYSYDAAGNLVAINGELGFSASFTYDDSGNVTSQTNALNQTTQFTYDADNLSGFTDARGNDILYGYDSRGNLTSITYEDGTQNKYLYDANG